MEALSSKKILITFARSFLTLELARQLNAAGHQVYVADSMDFNVSQFSNAVQKSFRVPSPRFDPKGYIDALANIVHSYGIDLLIPIYEEIFYLSKMHHCFPATCELFFSHFDLYDELHNKWSFQNKLKSLGIETLDAKLLSSKEDLKKCKFEKPYALKPCYSRASQKVRKILPNQTLIDLPLDPNNPWLAQEWLDGDRYCTYSICHQGKVYAHGTYPVHYAIDGNSCLTFEAVDHPAIQKWIVNLISKINFTGQIAFDFIESPQKGIFAIECNPRATSGVLLFTPEDRLDKAFFRSNSALILPKVGARQQIATGMLLYGWRKNALPNNRWLRFFKDLLSTKDVVFRINDIKPFLFEPLTVANIFRVSKKYGVSLPDAFIHDHEWNGEPLTFGDSDNQFIKDLQTKKTI